MYCANYKRLYPKKTKNNSTCEQAKDLSIDKLIDLKLKLLDYHHKAMSERRSLQYRGFLTILGFYVAIITLIAKMNLLAESSLFFRVVFCTLLIIFTSCYFFFSYKIECSNSFDRQKYEHLRSEIWGILVPGKAINQEPLGTIVKFSWAANWPLFMLFFVALFTCFMIFTLPLPASP